ncbi:Uncharacterised protein [Mycobacteroides abscessus subsp. abscessus]|nr:Uncharacterised protein [Mycobacteroides abscessus subsp. abscessus]
MVLLILSTISTGSVMMAPSSPRPMTVAPADTVHTANTAKNRKFNGRPRKLPRLTSPKVRPYREKSPKLSIGPEK